MTSPRPSASAVAAIAARRREAKRPSLGVSPQRTGISAEPSVRDLRLPAQALAVPPKQLAAQEPSPKKIKTNSSHMVSQASAVPPKQLAAQESTPKRLKTTCKAAPTAAARRPLDTAPSAHNNSEVIFLEDAEESIVASTSRPSSKPSRKFASPTSRKFCRKPPRPVPLRLSSTPSDAAQTPSDETRTTSDEARDEQQSQAREVLHKPVPVVRVTGGRSEVPRPKPAPHRSFLQAIRDVTCQEPASAHRASSASAPKKQVNYGDYLHYLDIPEQISPCILYDKQEFARELARLGLDDEDLLEEHPAAEDADTSRTEKHHHQVLDSSLEDAHRESLAFKDVAKDTLENSGADERHYRSLASVAVGAHCGVPESPCESEDGHQKLQEAEGETDEHCNERFSQAAASLDKLLATTELAMDNEGNEETLPMGDSQAKPAAECEKAPLPKKMPRRRQMPQQPDGQVVSSPAMRAGASAKARPAPPVSASADQSQCPWPGLSPEEMHAMEVLAYHAARLGPTSAAQLEYVLKETVNNVGPEAAKCWCFLLTPNGQKALSHYRSVFAEIYQRRGKNAEAHAEVCKLLRSAPVGPSVRKLQQVHGHHIPSRRVPSGKLHDLMELPIPELRFAHNDQSEFFTHFDHGKEWHKGNILQLALELLTGVTALREIPRFDVCHHAGQWYCRSGNRRLAALRLAARFAPDRFRMVEVKEVSADAIFHRSKLTTHLNGRCCEGRWMMVRETGQAVGRAESAMGEYGADLLELLPTLR